MTLYILKDNGQVVIWTTLWHLIETENQSKLEQEKKLYFDSFIKKKAGNAICNENFPEHITPTFEPAFVQKT